MPHDMNGNEIKVGSTVLVPCSVKAIHLTEQYCNVDLETNIAMHPTSNRTALTLNSRQTIRKGSTDQVDLLRASYTIVDYIYRNWGSLDMPDALHTLVNDLRPKLDKAIDEQPK